MQWLQSKFLVWTVRFHSFQEIATECKRLHKRGNSVTGWLKGNLRISGVAWASMV